VVNKRNIRQFCIKRSYVEYGFNFNILYFYLTVNKKILPSGSNERTKGMYRSLLQMQAYFPDCLDRIVSRDW
jgi:ribosomal protein S18